MCSPPLRRALVVGGIVVFLLALVGVRVPLREVPAGEFDRNLGELIGPTEVGVAVAPTGDRVRAVSFRLATYGRRNTAPLVFELRSAPASPVVLRSVEAPVAEIADHEDVWFRFAPVRRATGELLYASVRSPTATPGNAVTVVARAVAAGGSGSTTFLFREGRSGPDASARAKKGTLEIAHGVEYSLPLGEALNRWSQAAARRLVTERGRWWLDGRLLLVSLILASAVTTARWQRGRKLFVALALVILLGLALRILYATRLPLTNDEGFILADAWIASQGRLPGGDGLLKTPVVVGTLAAVLKAAGPSLLVSRWVSVTAGLLTALPLAALAWRTAVERQRRRAAVVGTALWLLAAAPAAFGVYGHAQSLQLLLATGAVAAWAWALSARSSRRWAGLALAAGALAALALGARKTSLAVALPFFVLLTPFVRVPRTAASRLVAGLVGAAVVLTPILFLLLRWYGGPGLEYALGISLAAIDPDTTASLEERRAALVAGVLPLFREALPLVFLAAIALGAALERAASRLFGGSRGVAAPARLAWLLPAAGAVWISSFVAANDRPEHLVYGIVAFWRAAAGAFLLLGFLPRSGPQAVSARLITVSLVWAVGAFLLYASWIKFTANYLIEFFPALVLLATAGALWVTTAVVPRRAVGAVLALALVWGGFSAARTAATFPHTGTFDRDSLEQAAAYLRAHASREDLVLTAAVAIPVLSGHRVPYDIAHPTHYAYGFIEPEVRNRYLVPAERMVEAVVRDVRWIVQERLTAFSYYREYPAIEEHVEKNFSTVQVIENRSNPLTIFQRRAP